MNIEDKHRKLIDKAINYMKSIDDFEHDINHVNDVVFYTKELMNLLNLDFDEEVLIISAYWHDVGRTVCNDGHEKISANMLKNDMQLLNYDNEMIDKCYDAIVNHKWNMSPETIEGKIIRDADKLAFIGINRWNVCLENKYSLDSIVELLPRLRNELLYFDESKKLYDRDIVNLIDLIIKKVF